MGVGEGVDGAARAVVMLVTSGSAPEPPRCFASDAPSSASPASDFVFPTAAVRRVQSRSVVVIADGPALAPRLELRYLVLSAAAGTAGRRGAQGADQQGGVRVPVPRAVSPAGGLGIDTWKGCDACPGDGIIDQELVDRIHCQPANVAAVGVATLSPESALPRQLDAGRCLADFGPRGTRPGSRSPCTSLRGP